MQTHQPQPHLGKQPKRGTIGPLVKTQSLFLNSGNTSTNDHHTHYDFSTQLNGLIKCANDEVMRVALVSANLFNSYRQINADNNTITLRLSETEYVDVVLPEGNYTFTRLAISLQVALSYAVTGTTVYYNSVSNSFRINWGTSENPVPVEVQLRGGLNVILGFRESLLIFDTKHISNREAQPHTLTDIVLHVFGVSPILSSHNIDNYSSPMDDCDVGHVLAVFPPPGPRERAEFVASMPESHAMYISEKSVNTLRVRLTNPNGEPLTWVNNQVGLCLQFSTYKRE